GEERRSLVGAAVVRSHAGVGVDRLEDRPDDALRADAVVVVDVPTEERRAGTGDDLEDAVGARVHGVDDAVVRAGVEVAGRTRDLAATAELDVPEQRLAEAHSSRLVDDVAADRLRHCDARERGGPTPPTIGERDRGGPARERHGESYGGPPYA